MTVTHARVTIRCDAKGDCPATYTRALGSVREVRREARQAGWHKYVRHGLVLDRCPDHIPCNRYDSKHNWNWERLPHP